MIEIGKRILFLSLLSIAVNWGAVVQAQRVSLWPADLHQKIFQDTKPEKSGSLLLSTAANEYESAQFGLRSDQEIKDLSLTALPLVHENGKTKIETKNIRIRPVGMIPIQINTPQAGDLSVRKAPCDMPDVLLEESAVSLAPNKSLGIWVTVYVPKEAQAGNYKGAIVLSSEKGKYEMPVSLTVFPFVLPEKRNLWITNWWFPSKIEEYYKVKKWSKEYWQLLEAYIKNMGDHRQNVLLIQWVPEGDGFVKATKKTDGTWSFDFSKMEQLIRIGEKFGTAERLELSHVGYVIRASHKVPFREATVFDEKSNKYVTSPAREWLEPTLKELCSYLKKTGRFDRSVIHIADEPFMDEMDGWRAASARIHQLAPGLKQIDAIESVDFSDLLDVWVPKLTHFDRWRDAYEARRANNEFWYYICCHPIGPHYPNRFMDLPGARIRALHWINYTERLTGYLHWGYNYWMKDAFGTPSPKYGPGDTHAVYPGKTGPLDSVRWEIERESVEDYEYLTLLTELTAAVKKNFDGRLWWLDPRSRSMEIGRRVVPDLTHTELDPLKIEQARFDLVDEIKAVSASPRLIVQSFPADNSVSYQGPVVIEIYGLTTPGAKVTVAGISPAVANDGQFHQIIWGKTGSNDIEIKAELNGKTTKTIRRFTVK